MQSCNSDKSMGQDGSQSWEMGELLLGDRNRYLLGWMSVGVRYKTPGFFLTYPILPPPGEQEVFLADEFGRRKSTSLDPSLFFSFGLPTYRKQPLCHLVL